MPASAHAGAPAPPPWRLAGALATIYVVWGSTYLAIRVMVETIPPLLGAGLRFLLAGAVMYAWVRARRPEARASLHQLAAAALVGVLLVVGGNGLVTVAEREVPSGLAALLIATEPLWVILLRRLTRERLPRGTFLGVVAGFAGVGLLLAPGQRPAGVGIAGLVLCLVAAASWATGSFASSRLALPPDALHSTALQMVFGGAVMVTGGLVAGEASSLDVGGISTESALALAYLFVFGSLAAFTAYAWLLQNAPISTVSTYAYVNPVIAVALGWAILSEPVSTATLAGTTIIVASVAFIMRREGMAMSAEPAPPAAEAPPAVETATAR